jgi:methylmalonyl-CoA mutase
MKTEQARNAAFEKAGWEDWVEAAKKSLKKESIDHLYSETYEGITLSPLYTESDAVHAGQYPGEGSYVRGFYGPKRRGWRIAQRIGHPDWSILKKEIASALQRGQDTLSFDPDSLTNIGELSFTELHELVDMEKVPLFIFSKSNFPVISKKLLEAACARLFGVAATDLISSRLEAGCTVHSDGKEMESWMSAIQGLDARHPELKTILIDAEPYHAGGGNAVQELGAALAEAVFYLEKMKEIGWKPEKTANKFIFHFAVGSQFFMEVAKLRAFRMLWKTVADAYGMPVDQNKVFVSAETSEFTKSVIDPYVNMLRAGSEAFSAVVGGVDFLHVAPFDHLAGEWNGFSERIARNTQLLLKEESFMDKVIDPAGGSFYIEALTKEAAEKGWAFFLEIDKNGGIMDSLQSGWLQKHIKETADKKMRDAQTRRQSIIGVNVYAISSDKGGKPPVKTNRTAGHDAVRVDPLPRIRLAQKFEDLRQRSAALEKKGFAPHAGLICLGQLKEYKPRADFAAGVLAAGGINAEWSDDCHSLDGLKSFLAKKTYPYYCLCGPDALYDQWAAEMAQWLKEHVPGVQVDIAGKYSDEELAAFGLDGSLYGGQNIYEKLAGLLDRWEGEIDG